MYCSNCGQEVSAVAIACPHCGVPPRKERHFCFNCGEAVSPAQIMCVHCGAGLAQTAALRKDKTAAGLLAIFLGSLGIHKFYLGYSRAGVTMLLLTIIAGPLTLGIVAGIMELIALIEGIIYLTKSDEEFQATYVDNQKTWF